MKYHSNKNLTFVKDKVKSLVYISDKDKLVGILTWNYSKKKWVFKEVIESIKVT
jgi:hypothetical protein